MPLTVATYHYVRPLAGSRYAGIKGLELDRFRAQVDALRRRYTPISLRDVMDTVAHGASLPANAILLTFDDGYADHYEHVLPVLCDRNVPAVFFPVASAVLERRLLDVNKVHFVLACQPDADRLIGEIETAIDRARTEMELPPTAEYRRHHWRASRFDRPETVYIKRLLQHALPKTLRARIAADLFRRWVTDDERSFADELYMNLDQLRVMTRAGMHIGGHGDDHVWMDRLTPGEQMHEIDGALALLAQTGVDAGHFSYAYPYGAYNDDTVRILAARGCVVAFTTKVGVATPGRENALVLPRLDTSDLPSDG